MHRRPFPLPLFALLAVALAGGCADSKRIFACPRLDQFRYPVSGGAAGTEPPPAMRPLVSAMAAALDNDGAVAPAGQIPDVSARTTLVLSGGGPWGAFGAGFLAGWSKAADQTRPAAFDLVTGVSTGALQATLAFLGPSGDAALVRAYEIGDESELLDRRGLVGGALSGAFAGTAPLEARVRSGLAGQYDRVAAEGAKGRLLLVGAVDALDGRMYAIDLTRIARTLVGREREDCYVGALMASAAVPIAFDRVELGGRPFFDGGVRQSVFVTNIQTAASTAMGDTPNRLYILVNSDAAAQPVASLKPGLVPTLSRLRELAINQIELTSIANVAAQAPPGFETYLATAAGHACGPSDAGRDAIFDPAFMRCLIAHGRARGESAARWNDGTLAATDSPMARAARP